ncbi:oligopeptide/dipeptide ABC transporter ATP-binding protein [Alkalibacillus filiformis]|uniref:Oligopeptide/dipeptide ABC transporter ATP-binding protein n=1 Tax=Alkalibacillus filiformis TaxID=200990 RepID=A0ABU0DSX0_9BACI|nr:ABC transporter ATP-binding protein [Alkalibacillus filiformis]MDQ0351418.1 oligopeptide/dipeptide ABC transporter ATP-binding protein [Alkalibacillus filiformis]
MKSTSEENQLQVHGLEVGFKNKKKYTQILNGVSFNVNKGETLCIVGESGCGKSLTSLSIMGLLPESGEVRSGEIRFEGQELTNRSMKEMSKIRGNEISMIFQEPMTSLNPVHTVGKQIIEAIRIHRNVSKKEATERVVEMFELVGIPSPRERVHNYPHEMSGGMRQRVMIAMALACDPKLLIADEPTTALDVTIQAQILDLLNELKGDLDMSIVMITHDLGVVSEMADQVLVMYAGEVIEYTDSKSLFENPKHPYTQGLIASIPKLQGKTEELPVIKGAVPNPDEMPSGCRFSTRCAFAKQECFDQSPQEEGTEAHPVRCWMYSAEWQQMTPLKGGESNGYTTDGAVDREPIRN